MSVENSSVVDLVAHDPKTDQVALVIVEQRPWDSSRERLLQLQQKIHNYVSYALDGQFARTYPDFVGKPLTIALSCFAEPDAATMQFLDEMKRRLHRYTIGLEVRVLHVQAG